MLYRSDMTRLHKSTREALLRELLLEFQGEQDCLLYGTKFAALFRVFTGEQVSHYVCGNDCQCSVCARIRRLERDRARDLITITTGGDWVSRMLTLIERRAPEIVPLELKRWMLFVRICRGRSPEELRHLAEHGSFQRHTPEQAEAERRYFEWKGSHTSQLA